MVTENSLMKEIELSLLDVSSRCGVTNCFCAVKLTESIDIKPKHTRKKNAEEFPIMAETFTELNATS